MHQSTIDTESHAESTANPSTTPLGPSLTPTLAELDRLQEQGLLKSAVHPNLPLRVFNYTQQTEYKRLWTPLLECCRGLVVDTESHTVVARPMRKFGNHGDWLTRRRFPELFTDPPGPPSASRGRLAVYDKIDGSLIIIFKNHNEWIVASRGSFDSPHAKTAADLAREVGMINADGSSDVLDAEWTYMFELLSPDLSIRVDYGSRRELILLAVIHTATGSERLDLREQASKLKVQTPDEVPPAAIEKLLEDDVANHEGYVLRWDDGSRMKIKFKSYWQIAKVNTAASAKQLQWSVIEELCKTDSIDKVLDQIDDERYDMVRELETTYRPKVKEFFRLSKEFTCEMIDRDVKLKDVQVEIQGRSELVSTDPDIPTITATIVCAILSRRQRHIASGGVADDEWLNQAARHVASAAFSKLNRM